MSLDIVVARGSFLRSLRAAVASTDTVEVLAYALPAHTLRDQVFSLIPDARLGKPVYPWGYSSENESELQIQQAHFDWLELSSYSRLLHSFQQIQGYSSSGTASAED